jgi:hypothetical protein
MIIVILNKNTFYQEKAQKHKFLLTKCKDIKNRLFIKC